MTTNKCLFNSYDKYYKCSETIDIAQQLRKYKDLIGSSAFHEYFEHAEVDASYARRAIGDDIDAAKYEILVDFCSVNQLTVEGELEKVQKKVYDAEKKSKLHAPIMPEVEKLPLMTLKRVKKLLHATPWFMQSKYQSEWPITYETSEIKPNAPTLIPETDFLIYVRIYYPLFSRNQCGQPSVARATPKLTFDRTIVLHGSQTLADLRDQISCVSDYSISTEMSKVPVHNYRGENAKHVYKSGFFFIDGTFYNDFRDPTNKDNSRVIREWSKSRNMRTNKTARMETTTVGSLILKFGLPGVYQHQGNCEHLITFSDARFVNPTDEINVSCYPRIVRIGKPKAKTYCMTCGQFSADWILMNHSRLPHNPCLQCDNCFRRYNYVNSRKIGSFIAYPHPRDNDLQQELAAIREKKASEKAAVQKESNYNHISEMAT